MGALVGALVGAVEGADVVGARLGATVLSIDKSPPLASGTALHVMEIIATAIVTNMNET